MKIEVYTAITGNFDSPRTDIKCFGSSGVFVKPVMEAKMYKIMPHKFLNCDYSIWLDGNISLNISPAELIDKLKAKNDGVMPMITVFKHPHRKNIFEEIEEIRRQPHLKIQPALMAKLSEQEAHYHHSLDYFNIINKYGLYECGMIIRRHCQTMENFNNDWMAEILRFQERDQVSFPIIAYKHNLKINGIEGDIRNHPYFTYKNHTRGK